MKCLGWEIDNFGMAVDVRYYESRQGFLRAIRRAQGKFAPKRFGGVYGMCSTYVGTKDIPAQFTLWLNSRSPHLIYHEATHAAMGAARILTKKKRLPKDIDLEEFICYLSTGVGAMVTHWVERGCPQVTQELLNRSKKFRGLLSYASYAFDVRNRLDGKG